MFHREIARLTHAPANMSCCQNPTNLGCFDSCSLVTIESLTGYAPNEVYISYNFNGATRKQLLTEVSATGQPIVDLSSFINEDYYYTFEVIERASGDSLGCFKIKVTPCAGDIFEAPALPPVTDYADTRIMFDVAVCDGETVVDFVVDIADLSFPAVKDGTLVNLAFTPSIAVLGMTLISPDLNIEIISNTQFKIISATAFVNPIEMQLKISGCNDMILLGVVTSLENITAGWGNGTHTQGDLTITF